MSDTWFNFRILFWHFKIAYGRLFRVKVSYNRWWMTWLVLLEPVWLHTWDPKGAWEHRHDSPHDEAITAAKG